MADTNTYQSFTNIKKYTTQEHFDAINKSDIPIGTEYNIVGLIEEEDLSTALRTKINSGGSGVTSLNGQTGAITLKTVFGNNLLGSGDVSMPSATASVIGGISLTSSFAAASNKFGIVKLGSDTVIGTGNKIYPIQLNSSGQMFVSVPWTDTNTTYSAGNGISISSDKAISLKYATTSEVGGFVAGTYTGENDSKTTALVVAPNGLLDISIDCGTWA